MKSTVLIAVALSLILTASAAPSPTSNDSASVETIRDTVRVLAVGGIESPVRRGISIDDRKFELTGERRNVDLLFENEGHEVEVRGVVSSLMVVGGEGLPLLTVLSVERLCTCEPASPRLATVAAARVIEALGTGDLVETPAVVETRVVDSGTVLVAVARYHTSDTLPVSREVRWYRYSVDGDRVESADVRDLCRADALSRYTASHPSDDPRIADGIHAAVRAVAMDADGAVRVRCERFGGIAGIWHGSAVEYTYDRTGRWIHEASLANMPR